MNALVERIEENQHGFSKGQKRIAAYIREKYDEAAFLTASRLGDTVGVSESTVVRFAYALGYNGYPELQEALQEMVRYKLTSMQRLRLASSIPENDVQRTVMNSDIANIRTSVEMIDKRAFQAAVDAILSAKHIYILGLRSARPLAELLAYYLDYVCDNVLLATDYGQDVRDRILRIGEGDVCVGISYPRYSSATALAMEFAKSRGATVIALTDLPASPIAGFADYALYARSSMASFADSLVAPLSLINSIIVAVGMARSDAAHEHLEQLESMWGAGGVYIGGKEEEA